MLNKCINCNKFLNCIYADPTISNCSMFSAKDLEKNNVNYTNKKRVQKQQYEDLKKDCLCNSCLGCNLLELKEFTGAYKCNNYYRANEEIE